MPKFKAQITETHVYFIDIEADNINEAYHMIENDDNYFPLENEKWDLEKFLEVDNIEEI